MRLIRSRLLLLLFVITSSLAAPAALYDDYPEIVSQKRAALVLDRLMVALQKALREDSSQLGSDHDGPRTQPLRVADIDISDLSSLQRRGQSGTGRGRVLRCYFNAVTCF